MSEEIPSETLAGLTLHTNDDNIPECVSSDGSSMVGSSVSQSMQKTVEVDAAMLNNAMSIIINLQNQVILFSSYNVYSSLELKSVFRLLICRPGCRLDRFQ
jgi:hypothetical protein